MTTYNKYSKLLINRGIWELWHEATWESYTDAFYSDKVMKCWQ